MPGEVLIELKEATVRSAAGEKILDRVSFSIRQGEILGFVFTHGVGKSTLLRTAASFFPPSEGQVLYRGQDVRGMRFKDEQRLQAKMGFVFQSGGLLVNTQVFDNVALPLRYHGKLSEAEIESKVMAALETVDMVAYARRFAWELTVARQKLVTLARALVREPEIILFDNFVTGTDMAVWETVNVLVRQLRASRNIAWMLVMEADPKHYAIADRICIIEDGKILAINEPDKIKSSSDQRVSRVFRSFNVDS